MGLQKVNKYSVVGGKKFANYKLCILHEYFRFDKAKDYDRDLLLF